MDDMDTNRTRPCLPPNGTIAALLDEAVDQGTRHQGEQRGIQLQWKEHQGSGTRRSLRKKKQSTRKCAENELMYNLMSSFPILSSQICQG
ncbi:hypothetical protein DPEC_G00199190 [Dallia pectoralis]|uniref:Uncharacterized protein n=1 Tax=Dallia pectoralis TaxID=75939 RepID=A0ACC2G8F3_DALPE|nr:hypothetical protein DPEC_G00199190 [Dallia pectoralis]